MKYFLQSFIAVMIAACAIVDVASANTMLPDLNNSKLIQELPVDSTSYGGTLILSDSPEVVPDDGIMYEDTVNGKVRLFFHHVNGTNINKKIVVLLVNDDKQDATVTVSKIGVAGPSHDWITVGKQAQLNYLESNDFHFINVPANGTALLDEGLDAKTVKPNMLVNGIYDFKTNKSVKVKVMMLPTGKEAADFAKSAKILPPDSQRLRGSFAGKDRLIIPEYVYDAEDNKVVGITLADNEKDLYLRGIDKTDNSQVVNYGNYGVVYKLYIPSVSQGQFSCYLNPRGGEYAGGLVLKYKHQKEQVIPTPNDKLSFGINTVTDIQYLGSFEGGQSLWFTFSPPGASNLPVKLILTPNFQG